MPGLLKLDVLPLKTQMAKDMETWQRLSEDLAQKRIKREQDTHAKDVFSHLLDAKDPETGKGGFSVPELVSEAGLLMVAGEHPEFKGLQKGARRLNLRL
jgi:cytochrome P450